MGSLTDKLLGLQLYKDWHSNFPREHLSLESVFPEMVLSEERIDKLAQRMNLKDMRILELGCLEGAHSLIMQKLGVKEILSVEGRKDNFLKCLIVKNAFGLDKCRFVLGDLEEILPCLSKQFDICFASGILYHLVNPIAALFRISELTTKGLFVWTHYSTAQSPKGPLLKIEYNGRAHRGKHVRENLEDCLSGLSRDSFWMLEEDLFAAVRECGFGNIEVIQREVHKHGPAVTFLARK